MLDGKNKSFKKIPTIRNMEIQIFIEKTGESQFLRDVLRINLHGLFFSTEKIVPQKRLICLIFNLFLQQPKKIVISTYRELN